MSRSGGRDVFCARSGAPLCLIAALVGGLGPASAQSLPTALIQAYQNNPQLNAQRAQVRVTDEAVPQALSGYRPRVSVTASAADQFTSTTTKSTSTAPDDPKRLVVNNDPRTLSGD